MLEPTKKPCKLSLVSEGKENLETTDSQLEQAMQDAVQAIENRERAAADGIVEVDDNEDEGIDVLANAEGDEAPAETEPKTDAATAVTEALITAKKELEEALEQTRSQYSQLRGKWMRAAADLDNYKKRARREREEAVKFGNERVLKDMLPIIDDLDRTLEVVDAGSTEANFQSVLDGIRMVQKKFLSQLEKHDVLSFVSQGKPFDPTQHEAVNQMHSEDVSLGGVVTEMRRGFFLSGRLLRPSLVTVSLGSENPDPTSDEKPEVESTDDKLEAVESDASIAKDPDQSTENLDSGE